MRDSKLRQLAVLQEKIQVVLVYNPDLLRDEGKQRSWHQFLFRLQHGRPLSSSGTTEINIVSAGGQFVQEAQLSASSPVMVSP